jgi:N-acetylglucosamine-6-sulfatase
LKIRLLDAFALAVGGVVLATLPGCDRVDPQAEDNSARTSGSRPNIVLILTDDHRADALGFMGHPYLETPNLDALAADGAHFANAFVTTSLCSPSRASILTGLYAHNHGIVDNSDRDVSDLKIFPSDLQQAGYQTAFIGKWHMGGGSDQPRPGFDRWVSFRGQGWYVPPTDIEWSLNVDGSAVPQRGYITDELTDYAIDWLDGRDPEAPFFLYLSHKAVHDNFTPADRHAGRYGEEPVPIPETQPDTPENYEGKPMWVYNQRNSWHGVDYPYHGTREPEGGIEQLYRRYTEAVLGVDDSVGRVIAYLKENGLADNTLVLYMGDNGFLWGEHGLIDKRNAYEESMRIPMIVWSPSLIEAGTVVEEVVANIDIAPTLLELAGATVSHPRDGQSFLGLATGEEDGSEWRESLLYEYYWEWSFPQTPSVFALRESRFKFIQYHGIWDSDELYDLIEDPREQHNLLREPDYAEVVSRMRGELFARLEASGANRVPFTFKRGDGNGRRNASENGSAPFPDVWIDEVPGAR